MILSARGSSHSLKKFIYLRYLKVCGIHLNRCLHLSLLSTTPKRSGIRQISLEAGQCWLKTTGRRDAFPVVCALVHVRHLLLACRPVKMKTPRSDIRKSLKSTCFAVSTADFAK